MYNFIMNLWRQRGGTTITVESILLEQKIDKIEMSPRGERQGGDGERES